MLFCPMHCVTSRERACDPTSFSLFSLFFPPFFPIHHHFLFIERNFFHVVVSVIIKMTDSERIKLADDSKVHPNHRPLAYQHGTAAQDRRVRNKAARHRHNQFERVRSIVAGSNNVDLSTVPNNIRKTLLHDYPDQFLLIDDVLTRVTNPPPLEQNLATWHMAPTWSFGDYGISPVSCTLCKL